MPGSAFVLEWSEAAYWNWRRGFVVCVGCLGRGRGLVGCEFWGLFWVWFRFFVKNLCASVLWLVAFLLVEWCLLTQCCWHLQSQNCPELTRRCELLVGVQVLVIIYCLKILFLLRVTWRNTISKVEVDQTSGVVLSI